MNKKLVLRVTALCMAMSMALSCAFGALPAAQAVEIEPAVAEEVVMQEEAVDAAESSAEEAVTEEEPSEEEAAEEIEAVEEEVAEAPVIEAEAEEPATGLIDFTSPTEGITIDAEKRTVTVENSGGDHFVVYDGMEAKSNSFIWEADVDFDTTETLHSAALIFGIQKKNAPGTHWSGANVDSGRGGDDAFRMFGPEVGNEVNCGTKDGIDFSKTMHFKLDIDENGNFTYSFGNVDGTMKSKTGTLASWNGGYLGLLTWNSTATFSKINFVDRNVEKPDDTNPLEGGESYKTCLTGMSSVGGTWEITEDGLHSDAIGKGDAFLFSETSAENYVYSTDVTFLKNEGAASLIFNNVSTSNHNECYAVNLEAGSKIAKFWRWTDGDGEHLINDKQAPTSENGVYNLKVVVINNWVSYYVNDKLLASSGDYTLQPDDRGQDTCLKGGYLGLLNWNGDMVFQNTTLTAIEGKYDPTVKNITVSSSKGTVEKKAQFSSGEPIFIQYVKNDASTVDINVTPVSDKAAVTVIGADGKTYEGGKNVPVSVGVNYIQVISTVTAEDGTTASLTYRVNVHRRQPEAVYYNEPYRDQYHYSVKDGWANDPNGLVYYKGTYHFFYQFYDAKRWGPMHWAHATSKDLVHWEEQPIAFYPDANGAMFSGCIVADETNASGLFSTKQGGLIAFITCDGNGQRIKLAYSEDEGVTWQKIDKIAVDWSRDPLGSRDFRDPKVFRWENKWFMVLAGGPLRIYSSENLVDWKCESTYSNLHTECPDLYPIKADDGAIKWVLSRGGRFYKIGDLKEVNGKWRFVPDAEYQDKDGVMNFGKDSYAAMTFYVQDFGTAAKPTLPDIIEINWMNTWDNYCNDVADKVGQEFNGTFNLALKEGVVKEGDTYLLTQTPVKGYDALRGEAVVNVKGETVTADNTILKDFAGDCYEIESTFYPAAGTTKVGFQLRVGEGEHTDVIYDLTTETLCIDRSKSGIQISSRFTDVDSQKVTRNADGSVTLHIYMDKASVEVFTRNDTAAGANQIFPDVTSLGAKVIVEGEAAKADITIYPMASVWDKVVTDTPAAITSTSASETILYVGDTSSMKVTLLPINVAQDVKWTVADESIVTVNANGASAAVTALKKGETTITAAAAADSTISKTFKVRVLENNFETNVGPFVAANGNWFVDDKTLHDDDYCNNGSYISQNPVSAEEYTLETKVAYTRGLINIFFAANSTNPFDEKHPYSIQIGDSQNIRLFFFAGDDIKTVSMGKNINDGKYHDVKITKTRNCIAVAIDGVEYLNHTFDSVGEYFNTNAHVGIGLWDGSVDVQTFNVNDLNQKPEEKPEVKPEEKPVEKPVVKPSKPTVSAAVTTKGIALKWTAKNAKKYALYRKSGSGSYRKIKTTSATSFVDTDVKNGVKYQYKVVAINGTEKSAASSVKTAVYVKNVTLSSVKGAKKALSVKWKKNSAVTGYQVQYSTSKSFKKAKTVTVKKAKTVSKTIKSLKKGTKYYVRIRGYKTVSGKKYYSAWSAAKSAKTK